MALIAGVSGKDSYKTPVFGMAERKGRVVAKAVPNAKAATLMSHVRKKVLPESTVYTEEFSVYDRLNRDGYRHSRGHHAEEIYVAGNVHTNTIEGFWSLLKRGIGGVHHSVFAKHLQGYLHEYAVRYNHRQDEKPIFLTFLDRVATPVG